MTALDVLASLKRLRIRLTITQQVQLHWRAPRGTMTRVLQGTIKSCQDQIIHLLTTGEDTELPTGVSLPETDYSQFLTWQTGKVPANAQLMAGPLPASKYHDVPTKPRTYMGRVCTVKVCQKHDPVATRSLRFAPSGMCCRCWERAKKTTTREAP